MTRIHSVTARSNARGEMGRALKPKFVKFLRPIARLAELPFGLPVRAPQPSGHRQSRLVGNPPSERETRVEQGDVGKSCIAQQRFVLLRGQHGQPFTDGRDRTFRVHGWYAGRHRKGGISGEPFRLLCIALRKAVVGDD
jgi:hypothetical protein